MGVQIPHLKGQFWWIGAPRALSAVSCAKMALWSICRLGYGLDWAEGCTNSIICARWRQCALMGGHFATTCRITWPVWGWGTPFPPPFFPCPFTSFFTVLFSFYLFLFTLSFSSFVHPFHFYQNSPKLRFQAGGRRKQLNLGIVCLCLFCVICIS